MIIDRYYLMASNSSVVISFAIAILLLLILMLLLSYNSKCNSDKVERFVNTSGGGITEPLMDYNERFGNEVKESFYNKEKTQIQDPYNPEGSKHINNDLLQPFEGNTEVEAFTNVNDTQDPTTCFKRDRLTKDDLLPKDANLKWAQINPSSAGDITDKNFLTAGYHLGINTVGQSLRNANLQLRSEIPNPQVAVSPWLISTIEPDVRPVSFEIGSAPSY
jgi:hypothetical protein